MWGLIIIAIIAVLFLVFSKKALDNKEKEGGYDLKPMYDDSDLAILKVFYQEKEIKRNQTIETQEEFPEIRVEGYNLKGERKNLDLNKLGWECSCPVVKFGETEWTETGLVNTISCNQKGNLARSIWVKYQSGLNLFSVWKMVFK